MSIDGKIGIIFIQIKFNCIPNQSIVRIDNRGAVWFNHSTGAAGGGGIASGGPASGGCDSGAYRVGFRCAAHKGIVGGIRCIVPNLTPGNDGVSGGVGVPLGVDSDVPGQLHRRAGRLGALGVQIPAAKGVALTGGGGGIRNAISIAIITVGMFV